MFVGELLEMRKRGIHLKRLVQGEGHRAGTHTSAVPAVVLRADETRTGLINTSVVDLQQNRHGLQYKTRQHQLYVTSEA